MCLGTVCGVVPLVSAVRGVRGFGLPMGRVWFRARPDCPPPFLVPACGVGVRAGPGSRLCPALLGWVVGVCFLRFFFWLLGVPVPGLVVPVPPSPFFRASLLALFFFSWRVSACFGVPFPGWSPFLAWCCWFWLGGPPVPLLGVLSSVPSGGGGLAASGGVGGRLGCCGLFSRPPPSPPSVFFFLGGGCLFLPLPSLGWRTHWPAFSVVFRAAVGGCVLFGRVPAPWVGWAMYTLGSAPLLAGLGPGSTGWAAAPGG